jgi:hypothetical protein
MYNDGQKNCILLLDEVYVKPMLTYHWGQLFGHAVNDNSSLANLTKYLLQSYSYVLLGNFLSDPLEKAFSKLRQGSGGTYFINMQQG